MAEDELRKHTPEELAAMCGCSLRHFRRLFRQVFGVSLRDTVTRLRLEHARGLLRHSDQKVVDIALESGFQTLGLFNVLFKRQYGVTPTGWRERHLKRERNGQSSPLVLALCLLALLHAIRPGPAPLPGGPSGRLAWPVAKVALASPGWPSPTPRLVWPEPTLPN
jgi:AraC-like DNA-binding protein